MPRPFRRSNFREQFYLKASTGAARRQAQNQPCRCACRASVRTITRRPVIEAGAITFIRFSRRETAASPMTANDHVSGLKPFIELTTHISTRWIVHCSYAALMPPAISLSSPAMRIRSEGLSTAMRRSNVFSQPALSQALRMRLAE